MASRVPDYQPGHLIPGTIYKVLKVLGQGGMGTVYEVEDTSVGKRYVLKTLHGDLKERQDLAQRLAREARALARLQHPNIIEVYTSGKTGDSLGLPYYVMERLNGYTLSSVLGRFGRLEVEQACEIAIDLLDALDHAHANHIVHRDVKPDNIFLALNREGRSVAKLIDFGIIKLATATSSATLHTGGRFIGTFRYAAPEQIATQVITPRTDLYSAGLVIYEMVAGRGPFDDHTGEVALGMAHAHVPPPPLSRYAQVPEGLEKIVMAALEKEPDRRPPDAFTFALALRNLKEGRDAPTSIANYQGSTAMGIDLPPMSAALPARPFGATTNAEAAPVHPSGNTTIADATSPFPLGTPHTVAAVSLPAAFEQPASMVDRRAETNAAAPYVPPSPRTDTAPIPLASPRAAPPPPVETFGPHTTETSQRRRTMRLGASLAIGGVVLVGAAAFIVAMKHPRAAQSAVGEVVPPPETLSSVTLAAVPGAAPMVTTQPTVVVEQPAPPAPTDTVKRTSAAPASMRAPRSTTLPVATASAAPSETSVRHRVGSGL